MLAINTKFCVLVTYCGYTFSLRGLGLSVLHHCCSVPMVQGVPKSCAGRRTECHQETGSDNRRDLQPKGPDFRVFERDNSNLYKSKVSGSPVLIASAVSSCSAKIFAMALSTRRLLDEHDAGKSENDAKVARATRQTNKWNGPNLLT